MVGPASNPERQPEQTAGPGVAFSLEFVGGERLEDDPPMPTTGYLVTGGRAVPESVLEIPVASDNEPLFVVDRKTKRLEVAHQGSALIVSMLQLSLETQTMLKDPSPRGVCFFDTKGHFYPFAQPLSVDLVDVKRKNGVELLKHTARLLMAEPGSSEVHEEVVAIDSIHTLATSPYRLQAV